MYTTITYIILKTGWYAIHIIKVCFTFHYYHTMNPIILTGLLMYGKYFHRSLGNNFNLKMDKTMT